ncbi:MAG: hypothetical protein QOG45_1237 [Chloroflexota bacterium]|nr:hypothetical protein [Chloroflexota bacterium]
MISAMRRLGRAFLRAPWAGRVAALTVTFGLLGANCLMVGTTVYAAAPAPRGASAAGSGIPSTGCLLLGLLCSQPAPTPTPTPATTPAPTLKPSAAAVTTTTPAPPSTPAAPAPPAAAGGCLLGLLGTCSTAAGPAPTAASGGCLLGLLGACSSTPAAGTCTQGASGCSAPTSSRGLCVLLCGVLKIGGNCVATLLQTCVVGTVPTPPPSPGSSAASSGACVGTLLCLLGSSCTASLGGTCLLGALLPPGLPSVGSGSSQSPAPDASSGSGGGTVPGSGSADLVPTSPAGTTRGVYLSNLPTGSSQRPSGGGGQSGLGTPDQPHHDETVGLVSGLTFGHGLIIWPLFGLLDLAALAGLVVVVRRRWTATSS